MHRSLRRYYGSLQLQLVLAPRNVYWLLSQTTIAAAVTELSDMPVNPGNPGIGKILLTGNAAPARCPLT